MHSGFENTGIDICRIFNYKTYLEIRELGIADFRFKIADWGI